MTVTMTKLLLPFLLAASLCQMAFGDVHPLAGQKITYSRNVPKNVARSFPRRTARLFWGTWFPKTGAPMMGIQLYEAHSGLTLELWEKKQKSFVKLNRLTGLYGEDFSSPSTKFSLDFYWLDGQRNTTPILVLTQITYGDENLLPGEYQQIKVISFASGWKNKPNIQTFSDGNSNAGIDGFGLQRDEKGVLELLDSSYSFRFSGTDFYDWDGKQFSLVPQKREEKHDSPPD